MWTTVGQDHILRQLSGSLSSGRVGHAYLLTGPPHVGKLALALDLASAVNCRRPDASGDGPCGNCGSCERIRRGVHADLNIQQVGGDPDASTRISIRQVRETENFLSTTPVEGGWKVVIFNGAETLSAGQSESANALLKTLEEPPPAAMLILLTTAADSILPTIRSRCRILALRPMPGAALAEYLESRQGVEPERAAWLARLSRGCPGWAISALGNPEVLDNRSSELDRIAELAISPLDERFAYANALASSFSRDRDSVRQTLYLWQGWWRDALLVNEGAHQHVQNTDRREEISRLANFIPSAAIATLLRRIQTTLTALDANANPRLTLECMMLDVPAG